jgi:lipid A ethanolaminephosphotransferase
VERPGSGWNPLAVAIAAGVWIAAAGNWPLWRALASIPETGGVRGVAFLTGFGVMIAALTTGLLALFAWRGVIKGVAALVILSAAVGAYFMGTYGIVLDPTMMTNVLQTDARETGDLLGAAFFASVLVLGVLPSIVLARMPLRSLPFVAQAWRNLLAIAACIAVIALLTVAFFADLSSSMRNHRQVRYLVNPVNAYWSLGVAVREREQLPQGPPAPIGLDARVAARPPGVLPPLLVLVIGETARADHFALNGYARPTDPELATLPVVSFSNVTSCGTNTAQSLPCMFSALDRRAFQSRSADAENLLDLVYRAGLAVLWVDNQSGCKGLCERVPNANADEPAPGGTPLLSGLCRDGECYDEALLHDLDRRIAALPAERRERGVLLVLHQMGSHGPAYHRRSPADRKRFQPECTSAVLQQCPLDAVVNAYDNSIAYTDHVLADTIRWLGRQEAYAPALVYVSDHGESLGEKNVYLHGLPWAIAPREQTHVPLIAWLGNPADPAVAKQLECLRKRRAEPLTHDNLFHTALGQLGVQAREYVPALDAFAACRGA